MPSAGTSFTVHDPRYEEKVRESFARQRMMATLGAKIARVAPGEVDVEFAHDSRFVQQNDFMHAGAIASIADSANGYAAFTLAPAGTDVLAVEFKINLLAPARAKRFVAEARVLRAGRTITVCRADVHGLGDGAGDAARGGAHGGRGERELIATMLSTIIVRTVRG